MPTEVLTVGPIHTMLQNVIYAMPGITFSLFTNTAGATFEASNDPTMASVIAITLTEGATQFIGPGFLRSTAGNALVRLTRF